MLLPQLFIQWVRSIWRAYKINKGMKRGIPRTQTLSYVEQSLFENFDSTRKRVQNSEVLQP